MRAAIALTTLASALAVSIWACGGDDSTINPLGDGGNGSDGNANADTSSGQDTSTAPDTSTPCVGTDLRCKKVSCGGSVTTDLSGTVYDPAGKRTLYNVIVYVPNKTPDPLGAPGSCDRCGTVSGDPIVAAVTDANGNFTLKDVPAGASIPLVIQTGKWRRQVTVPTVSACVDNVVDKTLTRLPAKASEGDMPSIAIASSCDPLECTLRKFGIDDTEFVAGAGMGTGHVHVYQQNNMGMLKVNGTATPAATTLWATSELTKYDMLLNTCECGPPTNKGAAYAAVQAFLDTGGRVLGNHYAYDFFAAPHGPAETQAAAAWLAAPMNVNSPDYIDQSFPKGKAFSDWLVGNLGGTAGQMNLTTTRNDVGGVKLATSRYIFESNSPPDAGAAASTKYLSFQAPVESDAGTSLPAAQQCGRAGFADFHAYGGFGGGPGNAAFPDTCNTLPTSMADEEYAFEFIFFELGTCIQDETMPPAPPSATP